MFSVASLLIAKREKEPKRVAADKWVSKMSRTGTLHCNKDESEHVLSEKSSGSIYTKCLGQTTHQDRKIKLGLVVAGLQPQPSCRLRQVILSNLVSPCFKMKCRNEAGNTAQWQSGCLTCTRPWVQFPVLQPPPGRTVASACPSPFHFGFLFGPSSFGPPPFHLTALPQVDQLLPSSWLHSCLTILAALCSTSRTHLFLLHFYYTSLSTTLVLFPTLNPHCQLWPF